MSHLRTFLVILGFLSLFVPASSAASSSIREKKLSFPPSIQWKTVDAEISLIALAWGPANSPEMISKGRQSVGMEKPELLSDRPYALALRFQAKAPGRASLKMSTCSGLIRIKNVDGDRENPWVLTRSGFLLLPTVGCGAFDVDFKENNPTEYWDFFPVPPSQKEFLFEVFPPTGRGPTSNPVVSFRVMIKANDFVILNASPPMESECPDLTRNFAGTVGPNSRVNLQLTRKGTNLSGTHQYAKIGETRSPRRRGA